MKYPGTDATYSHLTDSYEHPDGSYTIEENAIWTIGQGHDNHPVLYRKAIAQILKANVTDFRTSGDHGIFLDNLERVTARSTPDLDTVTITITEVFLRTRTIEFRVREREREIFRTRVTEVRRSLDALSTGTAGTSDDWVHIEIPDGDGIESVSNRAPQDICPVWIRDFWYPRDQYVLTLWKDDLERIARQLPALEAHYEEARLATADLADRLNTITAEMLNTPVHSLEEDIAENYAREHARYGLDNGDPVKYYVDKRAQSHTMWLRHFAAYRMPLEYSGMFRNLLERFEALLETMHITYKGVDLRYDSFTRRWEVTSNIVDDIDYLRKQTDTVKLAAIIHMIAKLVNRARAIGININIH